MGRNAKHLGWAKTIARHGHQERPPTAYLWSPQLGHLRHPDAVLDPRLPLIELLAEPLART